MGSEWQKTTLGKAFEVNPFRPLKRNTVTPFVPMDALPVNARATDRIESREYTGSGMRFQNGDTLIARITPCLENGKTAFVSGLRNGEVAHGSTEYIVLSGIPGKSDPLFGYYLSRSPVFRSYAIGHMEGTSGRQRVPASAVENFPLLLPPIEEQRAITHILGTLDDKIELNRQQNKTLEEMARALFKAWFVDFEPVRAKMEGRWQPGQSLPDLPAHLYDLFPDRLIETEQGEIPEGWQMRSLDSVASYLNGLALQKFPPESETEFLPVIKIAQLRAGNTNSADKASTQIKPEYVVNDGDVLFSWSGSLEVEVWNGGRGALNQHLFKVTSSEVPKWFYFFATRHHLPDFRTIAAGKATTMGHIQRKHLTAAKIAIATPEQMEKIDAFIAPQFEKMIRNAQQSRTLAQLRDTLLPKLIAGGLRVADVEAFLRGRGL
ncbi:restriction endonuclease subunit S [Allofranklinella schreckenbergeri]|nr:restriction endonuclease subunit S [Allofranklinella schreckenbergeri]